LKMKKTNDFPKGSRSLVEFALSIKDQENGKDRKYPGSRFSRNLLDELVGLDARLSWHVLNFFLLLLGNAGRCQFCSKHHRWGWKKFISLEDFKDSSKGYLIKGKCCIEAEVAISDSSKTEYSK
jgi:hypothetical protein